jgi:hypothetical protein
LGLFGCCEGHGLAVGASNDDYQHVSNELIKDRPGSRTTVKARVHKELNVLLLEVPVNLLVRIIGEPSETRNVNSRRKGLALCRRD